jgi:DNA-binding transcriptional ArsR family regulator
MSAHLAILREAGLIEAEKQGRMIYYRLKISVLEDALLSFTGALGIDMRKPKPSSKRLRKGYAR